MIDKNFWPPTEAFLDLSRANEITDGRARCTGVALCDEEGWPTGAFHQGQSAHFFYEFEVLGEIGIPSGGLLLSDTADRVIHGKNTFQYSTPTPKWVRPGARLRYHHVINLEVGPDEYTFSVGLASTDEASYASYREGPLTHQEFAPMIQEHCRVMGAGSLIVQFDPAGKLLHHGVANLPGDCKVTVVKATLTESSFVNLDDSLIEASSTIFHITHWKAGSQWIHKILRGLMPDHIVEPQLNNAQFLHWPVQPGKVYPTAYMTRQQFDSIRLPPNWRRFVVIRDLRDTLVSGYFSMKVSHPLLDTYTARLRSSLQSLSLEEGLLYLMDNWLSASVKIQISWLEADEPLIQYEALLGQDLEILEKVLLDKCQLPVSREKLHQVVLANRFERLTGGRRRGQENIAAHERKGIAGDWKTYFSERVKQAFKVRYGGLLVATDYEKDLNW